MSIITISQIKHRRGIKGVDPMPQLASAELGWAIDTQELYIGNGTITEGAPATGNTEILTEHSDLTALLSDYTYSGPFSGASMQTGLTIGSPIIRTNDDHDDDRVNVRSFGAAGDGATDDTAAIQRAIDQHFLNLSTNRYWTTLYFPAGTYVISARLQVPSHVRLVGDGFNSSIIQLSIASNNSVIEMERLSGADPEDIYIAGIGFQALNSSSHVCTISNGSNITFDRCSFNGASPNTTIVGNHKACVLFNPDVLEATAGKEESTNIRFNNCLFTGATYGIATSTEESGSERFQNVSNVTVSSCVFDVLYKGIVLGFETGTLASTDPFPREWRVSNSFFKTITREGIYCYKATKCTSAINHFADVGNLQSATPTYANIVFGDSGGENPIDTVVDLSDYEGNYSIGDQFDRDDTDNLTIQRVVSYCLNSYIIDPVDIRYGSLHIEPGRLIRLVNNTAVATASGIALDSDTYQGAIIDYQLNRGVDQRRTGTFVLVLGETNQGLSEDFVETTTACGVTFSLNTVADAGGDIATIEYTTTNETYDAVLSYSVRHLTCLQAVPVLP